jgi:hypothetical protein
MKVVESTEDQGPAPTSQAKGPLEVHIGMTVLFCLDIAEPVLRPLIVTAVHSLGRRVDGLLVYRGEGDRDTQWCRKLSHFQPIVGGVPCQWVYDVHYGHGPAEWRFLEDHR